MRSSRGAELVNELLHGEPPPPGTLKVQECVVPLLKHEPDLLQEFLQYLPNSCFSNGHTHMVTNGHYTRGWEASADFATLSRSEAG